MNQDEDSESSSLAHLTQVDAAHGNGSTVDQDDGLHSGLGLEELRTRARKHVEEVSHVCWTASFISLQMSS